MKLRSFEDQGRRLRHARSGGSVLALAIALPGRECLSESDWAAFKSTVSSSLPWGCGLSFTDNGADIAVVGGAMRAASLGRDLVKSVAALRLSGTRRLSVGAGLAVASDSERDLHVMAELAAAAAQCSLLTGDHLIVQHGRLEPKKRTLLVRTYGRVSVKNRPLFLLLVSTGLAVIPSFLVYCAAGAVGINLIPFVFWVLFGALLLTAMVNYAEAFTALDAPVPPPEPEVWPALTALVSAYLPNEVEVVEDTCRALLRQDYPGPLQVVLAFNGHSVPALEARLRDLAYEDPRLELLAVEGSGSKAQNLNAAVDLAVGEIIGIFDADHRPAPGSFRRAVSWLSAGNRVDVVQGHCSVRNGADGWLQKLVAIEFETIYAVSHPGRAGLHQFGLFGGSNGYWRASILSHLRLDPSMLTEDIDVSFRALLGGARIVSDPGLVSYELAPAAGSALWNQRIRWAQGWSQVSRKYARLMATAPGLSSRQRLGALWITLWRDFYPWISPQLIPLILYRLVTTGRGFHLLLLSSLVTTIFTSGVGPIQSLFACRLAPPHLRQRETRSWWWSYLLLGSFYGEWRTAVCRAAHLREAMGDRGWVVTPRVPASPVKVPKVEEGVEVAA